MNAYDTDMASLMKVQLDVAKLAAALQRRPWTKMMFAAYAGCSYPTVVSASKGRPIGILSATRIAGALRCSVLSLTSEGEQEELLPPQCGRKTKVASA